MSFAIDHTQPVCRCGAPRHATDGGRCASGHTWTGTPGPALVVGHDSALRWAAEAAARREIRQGVMADVGHTETDAPRALSIAAESIAQATIVRDSAYSRIAEAGGPLASSGRVRRAFAVWAQAVDRVERHLRLVGLRRQPRPVDPLQAVRQAVAEANQR